MLKTVAPWLAPLVICSGVSAGELWLIADRSLADESQPVWVSLASGDLFPLASDDDAPPPITHLTDRHDGLAVLLGPLLPQDRNLSIRRTLPIGLHILTAESASWGERGQLIRRFAKTHVRVGSPDETSLEAPLQRTDQDLEIIPLSDPTAWQFGSTLRFRVLLEGYPWAGVAVSAGREGMESAAPTWSGHSDSNGEFRIERLQAGHGYVRAAVVRPRWSLTDEPPESLVATFSFHVRPRIKNPAQSEPVAVNRSTVSP